MREAWRIQKAHLYPLVPDGKQLHLFLVFTATEAQDLGQISNAVQKAISKLANEIGAHE